MPNSIPVRVVSVLLEDTDMDMDDDLKGDVLQTDLSWMAMASRAVLDICKILKLFLDCPPEDMTEEGARMRAVIVQKTDLATFIPYLADKVNRLLHCAEYRLYNILFYAVREFDLDLRIQLTDLDGSTKDAVATGISRIMFLLSADEDVGERSSSMVGVVAQAREYGAPIIDKLQKLVKPSSATYAAFDRAKRLFVVS